MGVTSLACLLPALVLWASGELLQNGGFESAAHWGCNGFHCTVTSDKHAGSHALQTSGRQHTWQGPTQNIPVVGGQTYTITAWVKLLNDHAGQWIQAEMDYQFTDKTHHYETLAAYPSAKTADGWSQLQGSFTVPTNKALDHARVYFQSGPSAAVNFAVDAASVTQQGTVAPATTDHVIDQLRRSDIHLHVTTAAGINSDDVSIHVVQTKKSFPFGSAISASRYNSNAAGGKYRDFIHQHLNWAVPENALKWPQIERNRVVQTKKSFPFGTAVSAPRYNSNAAEGKYRDFIHQHFNWAVPGNALKWYSIDHWRVVQTKKSFPFGTAVSAPLYNSNAAGGKYRDFIHQHFNWAVPKNALKWYSIDHRRGQKNYQPALDMVRGLKNHGIKVRGHNLVWSVPRFVQGWVKQLSGDALRTEVKHHIEETMNETRGLLEHWDVNNENLHGTWYQDQLHDPAYNLELFRIAQHADPTVKLFLNDYNVVASGGSTSAYVRMAQQFKDADVGLYGIGVQCHFGHESMPNAAQIKHRLDSLAAVGVPIWVTELDVQSTDENTRADFYEAALRALYSHPSVEGILMWGFWDQAHWRGEDAALVKGDDLQLTAAGRRVLDLYENQWMTDETHTLSNSGNQITVRGFHGDYDVHVMYQGKELTNLMTSFSLGKAAHTVNLNVHS